MVFPLYSPLNTSTFNFAQSANHPGKFSLPISQELIFTQPRIPFLPSFFNPHNNDPPFLIPLSSVGCFWKLKGSHLKVKGVQFLYWWMIFPLSPSTCPFFQVTIVIQYLKLRVAPFFFGSDDTCFLYSAYVPESHYPSFFHTRSRAWA